MKSSAPSPLVGVGMHYVTESCGALVEKDMHDIENALTMFLSNQMSFKECAQVFTDVLNTKRPLNRILAILQTPDTPIPESLAIAIPGKNHHWAEYEDRRLLAGIHRYGTENWSAVAAFVGNGRTRSQCKQRWSRGLNPSIRKDKWTPEEEARLLALINSNKYKSWSAISAHMGNRSDVQCRYHYKQMTGMDGDRWEGAHVSASVSAPVDLVVRDRAKVALPPIGEMMVSASHSNGQLLDCPDVLNLFKS